MGQYWQPNLHAFVGAVLATKFTRTCWGSIGNQIYAHFLGAVLETKFTRICWGSIGNQIYTRLLGQYWQPNLRAFLGAVLETKFTLLLGQYWKPNLREFVGAVLATKFTRICWASIGNQNYANLLVQYWKPNLRAFVGAVLATKFARICWGSIGNQILLITENLQRHFIFSLGKTKYIAPVMATSVQFKLKGIRKKIIKTQSYYLNRRFPDLAGWSARSLRLVSRASADK